MITTILLLWIASQLTAPTWVFALIWVRFGIFCTQQSVIWMCCRELTARHNNILQSPSN